MFPAKTVFLFTGLFLSLCLPGNAEGSKWEFAIPILCYHQVLPTATGKFEVSCNTFKTQMALLKTRGYQPVNTVQLLDLLSGRSKPTGQPVVISFDDGYKSVYQFAFPIMKEYGFVGIACIYPEFINGGGGMSWGHLKEMAESGWTIECHSYSHPDLSKVPGDQETRLRFLHKQIVEPKETIEKNVGQPVRIMTWPYGIYTEEAEAIARKAGYIGAFTVDGGGNFLGIDPFRIKRQVVYQTDDLDKFTIRLEMGALEVRDAFPRPGQVLESFSGMHCLLPWMEKENPDDFVMNAKVTGGGTLDFSYDRTKNLLTGAPTGKIKSGAHFIDVYLRDKRTGITHQNGWLFNIRK